MRLKLIILTMKMHEQITQRHGPGEHEALGLLVAAADDMVQLVRTPMPPMK